MADAWLSFERINGTVEQVETCMIICKARLKEISESKATYIANKTYTPYGVGQKRKLQSRDTDSQPFKKRPPFEKPPPGHSKRKPQSRARQDYPELKEESMETDGVTIKTESEVVSKKFDDSKDKVSIFISNLDYTTTDELLREALNDAGIVDIVEQQLVVDPQGMCKGYAYVELKDADAVEKALMVDRRLLNGRPMFISRCQRKKEVRLPVFKYNNTLEPCKLFVRGLTKDVTQDELWDIFKKYGDLKDVRLVSHKDGTRKGMAFIEFESDIPAAKAVIDCDQMELHGSTISVALSEPPPKKDKSEMANAMAALPAKRILGAANKRFYGGDRKSVMSFIPQSVKTAIMSKKLGTTNATIPPKTAVEAPPAGDAIPPKSNDEFRKMLLG